MSGSKVSKWRLRMAKKKNTLSAYEKRRLRTQQIIFIVIGGIVILSMVISLLINI
jgi:hypothetical protein